MKGSSQAGRPGISREELQRVAEQVARILALQQLEDGGAARAAFGRSTASKYCSAMSVACEIKAGELTAA